MTGFNLTKDMKKLTAIKLENVSKKYITHADKPTLVESFLGKSKTELNSVLDQISIKIKSGERIGLIGPNGVGKTTLLKIIAEITKPTAGVVNVNGKVVALLDLSAGFQSDLSGRENVFLNGMLIGMPHQKIRQKFDKIVEFSGLKDSIDNPIFTYSDGMLFRLGFAVAIHSNFDILLMDEMYLAGDESFKFKAKRKLNRVLDNGRTLVAASHNLASLNSFVNQYVYLKPEGEMLFGGREVLDSYRQEQLQPQSREKSYEKAVNSYLLTLPKQKKIKLTVVSDSMEPVISIGDDVTVLTCGLDQVKQNDIVIFLDELDRLVVHRLKDLAKDQGKMITQGDNSLFEDLERQSGLKLLGKVVAVNDAPTAVSS
jgi:ABC-type polysaccharide/polyol phosphate transport system ATPase subunit